MERGWARLRSRVGVARQGSRVARCGDGACSKYVKLQPGCAAHARDGEKVLLELALQVAAPSLREAEKERDQDDGHEDSGASNRKRPQL